LLLLKSGEQARRTAGGGCPHTIQSRQHRQEQDLIAAAKGPKIELPEGSAAGFTPAGPQKVKRTGLLLTEAAAADIVEQADW